ncbi:MAG: alpha/beta hydrolase [Mariniblastus sp.]
MKMKFGLTLLFAFLLFPFSIALPSIALAQTKQGAANQDKANQGKANQGKTGKGKTKKSKQKKLAPFQWVNPISKSEQTLPGLRHATFESPSLKVPVGFCIYLPPRYQSAENKTRRYPVVYYLHGGRPGSERKSVRLVTKIDKLIAARKIPPMIYVFVNGGPVSHYNMPDQPDAQGADVFIKELIPHVDANFRTVADRTGRGLEGFSQGGRGTARLSLRYPELFCSAAPGGGGHATERRISENGGAESEKLKFAEGDNTWDLAKNYAQQIKTGKQNLRILVYVGDQGFNYKNNLQWMEHLTTLGIERQKLIVPDVGHNGREIYEKNGFDIMNFHVESFRAAGSLPAAKQK